MVRNRTERPGISPSDGRFNCSVIGMLNPSETAESTVAPSLTELEQEERRRFSLLSLLHEQLTQSRTVNGLRLLEIARRRWLEARSALRQEGADD